MDIVALIKLLLGLSALLTLLLLFYLYRAHKKKRQPENIQKADIRTPAAPSLEDILKVIKEKASTTKELDEAVKSLLAYHAKIPPKRGMNAHSRFALYSEILIRVCHHPNTNKEIVLGLERELIKQNPVYKLELEDSLNKGLNTRGI